jgi:hypothetical protein
MTAQEKGMMMVGQAVRQLVPPQLDFVVIVYPPDGALSGRISYTTSTTVGERASRAVDAAAVFIADNKGDQQKPEGN